MQNSGYSAVFRDRTLAVILVLGFSSGFPLALTGGTFQAWLTVEGLDLATIGLLTLVGIPYTWKFLWAPLLDRYVPPFLGRRRGWLLVSQLALAIGIAAMAFCSPRSDIALLSVIAVLVAFLSASQDIVYDAYRTDIAKPEQRGLAAALTVFGYRVAMLTSGAAALTLVVGTPWFPGIGWRGTYLVMATLMALCAAATLWGKEPVLVAQPPRTLKAAVLEPLREFFSRAGAWSVLLLIVLYKLGDAFAADMTTPFLVRGVGFDLNDIAFVRVLALITTIAGALVAGSLMIRLGLYRSLMAFGVLQAVSNLGFMALAYVGKSHALLISAVAFENFTGGMGTAAFVALLMALCDHRFTATQYALLSALASVGRVYVGPAAGYATDPRYLGLDWVTFFFVTFIAALPGLALLYWNRTEIHALDRRS